MKLASILVATAGVGLAGYAVSTHLGLGGDAGPVAEVVTLPAKRAVPDPAPAIRTSVASEAQNVNQAQSQQQSQKAVAVPGDRASLARALQRELQRVGCYDGEVNGAWTTSTRMAMKAFTDRVNATLPIEAPDYILLSLVQRHEGRACGTNCPAGQLLSDDGRCIPSAVLAKPIPKPGEAQETDKLAVASASSWSPTAGLAPDARSQGLRGDAALVAPKPESASSEPRDERSRMAATRPDVDRYGDARERTSGQRSARADDVPDAEAYDEPPRRKVRRAKRYKQPKIVRKLLRSMRRSLAGLPW